MKSFLLTTVLLLAPLVTLAEDASRHPDLLTILPDLENPPITSGEPQPGKTVLQSLPTYAGTEVAHTVYLPPEWGKGKSFPVIIEYLGNNIRVRDNNNIGYALSGGKGFIWAVLPIVSADGKSDMDWWWGDMNATVAYAKEAVPAICRQWGGDPAKVILVGYSRGAIACNYVGLHDDEIARLWRAVIPVSHYDDGHTAWGMTPEERGRAPERLHRLGKTPQLICGEYSSRSARGSDAKLLGLIKDKSLTSFTAAKTELKLQPLTELEGTRLFVARHHPHGNFTMVDSTWVNHGPAVLYRDTLERRQMRDWLQQVLRADDLPPAKPSVDAYARRIELVRQTPGLVAFWDFVKREEHAGGSGRFLAHTAAADDHRYVLEPRNISRDFWREGEEPTLADFPLLGRGPFGQAVQFSGPKAINDIPVLMVPRAKLHDTPLDIKGPGKSASMVVWLVHQAGNHAIAGMWHEGTDTPPTGPPAVVPERGQRQFGMFAGLAANPLASSAHISENGLASFGDRYARHLAVTKEKMISVNPLATLEQIDAGWSAVGFVFDNAKNTVTAYLNGNATEYWIDEPAKNRFYRSAEGAWRQARLASIPGLQSGENPRFPRDQFYAPPETTPVKEEVVSETNDHRVVVRTYEFTKVRVTLQKDAVGKFTIETATDLVALKANPYWFGHDIYTPPSSKEGSPFTIGRVIHSNRHATLSGFIGGVAVFDQPLTPAQMRNLADIGTIETTTEPAILKLTDLTSSALVAACLFSPLAAQQATNSPATRPLLFANYYCWYHDAQHPKRPFLHWTYSPSETNALAKKAQMPGEPPPNSVFRPLVGLYDSADPKVAEWHVQLAKAAGIDAFLVDWWDTHNALDQNVDLGIVAAARKHGFKFALLDERAQFHQKFEDYQEMLARGLKRYKDNPAYLRIDGRPVVYLYQVATEPGLTAAEFPLLKKHVEGEVGPVYWIVDKISHDAKAANAGDKDREKRIPADWLATPGVDSFAFYSTFSNFRVHEYESLAGKYRYLTKLAHDAGKKMLLPVHPGHDNSHFREDPYVMPRRDGQTLRDFLRAATNAGADYIMVTSWNEWPESTVVEPSSSWPDPYLYLKILAEWKGVPFTEPPLPALKAKQP